MLLKILPFAQDTSPLSEQIMPILRLLCYNGSLVTWTVVGLTTAKFKPLIFSLWLHHILYPEYVHFYDFVWYLLVACTILLYRVFRAQADWTFILPSELPVKELRHLPKKNAAAAPRIEKSDKPAQWTPYIIVYIRKVERWHDVKYRAVNLIVGTVM
jgi:hypothetical protein